MRADPPWVRGAISRDVAFLGLFIVVPLINVFTQAFSKGVEVYVAALTRPRQPRRDPPDDPVACLHPSRSTACSA